MVENNSEYAKECFMGLWKYVPQDQPSLRAQVRENIKVGPVGDPSALRDTGRPTTDTTAPALGSASSRLPPFPSRQGSVSHTHSGIYTQPGAISYPAWYSHPAWYLAMCALSRQ